jgi:hypothetical protein
MNSKETRGKPEAIRLAADNLARAVWRALETMGWPDRGVRARVQSALDAYVELRIADVTFSYQAGQGLGLTTEDPCPPTQPSGVS